MHVVRAPTPAAACEFLREEIARLRNRRGHLVQILGGCTVDYQGRAASTLDQGERLVLLKPDGTLLVHTATKAKPVNWMPPGQNEFSVALQPAAGVDRTSHTADGTGHTSNGTAHASEHTPDHAADDACDPDVAEDVRVVLTAQRRKPHQETVRIIFHDILLLQALPLRDSEELVLRRTEGDLHQLFFERPELVEEGLTIQRGEKGTRRGPLDLWGADRNGNRVIIEVKRSQGGISEATQLWRYVEMERNGRFQEHLDDGPVQEMAEGRVPTPAATGDDPASRGPRVRGILVCPGISPKAKQMLDDHRLEHVNIDWDDLLAHLDTHRSAGQATLGAFSPARGTNGAGQPAEETAAPVKIVQRTVRTGRKR